jgi:hypothetical protein
VYGRERRSYRGSRSYRGNRASRRRRAGHDEPPLQEHLQSTSWPPI